MKKIFILVCISALTSLLIAGGNTAPTLAPVEKIPNTDCKADAVYVERDVSLMWQDQSYTDAEDGAYKREHSVAKAGKHRYAMNYCRTLNYSGYSDWRLPTSEELMHVHDKQFNPFMNHRGSDFWTSTPAAENRYYVVYTADAFRYVRKASESNYIRCVRCMEDKPDVFFK